MPELTIQLRASGPVIEAWIAVPPTKKNQGSKFLIGGFPTILAESEPKMYEDFQKMMVRTMEIIIKDMDPEAKLTGYKVLNASTGEEDSGTNPVKE